jgi:hypothetical protein
MSSTAMLKRIALTAATCAALSLPAAAQNLFATVVTVNDAVITSKLASVPDFFSC